MAARLRELLADSEIIDGSETENPRRNPPQDAYSLRCTPQVLGPVAEVLDFVRGLVETEINAVTDNPLIVADLPRSLKAVSGGNFHAEYMAFASDILAIAATEIGNIAERRIFRLSDSTLNRGLPDYLIDSEKVGLDCGYMLPQYLAAALVSDCKTLAHPDSVDSIPSSANQEDHVSMANNAGRHAGAVVRNIRDVIAVELLMATQALELRLRAGTFEGVVGVARRTRPRAQHTDVERRDDPVPDQGHRARPAGAGRGRSRLERRRRGGGGRRGSLSRGTLPYRRRSPNGRTITRESRSLRPL